MRKKDNQFEFFVLLRSYGVIKPRRFVHSQIPVRLCHLLVIHHVSCSVMASYLQYSVQYYEGSAGGE